MIIYLDCNSTVKEEINFFRFYSSKVNKFTFLNPKISLYYVTWLFISIYFKFLFVFLFLIQRKEKFGVKIRGLNSKN